MKHLLQNDNGTVNFSTTHPGVKDDDGSTEPSRRDPVEGSAGKEGLCHLHQSRLQVC